MTTSGSPSGPRARSPNSTPTPKSSPNTTPLSKPCTMRRLSVDHNGNIWYALDSVGKIGMMDTKTGKMVEYTEPVKFGFPYDIKEDHDYNLWIADSGQGGGIIKFEPKTRSSPITLQYSEPTCRSSKCPARTRSGIQPDRAMPSRWRSACCIRTSRKSLRWRQPTSSFQQLVIGKPWRACDACSPFFLGDAKYCSGVIFRVIVASIELLLNV